MKMPLRVFKALLAQTNLNVMMVTHVARMTLETIVAVLFILLFVVKTGLAVAPKDILAVAQWVVVLFLTLFVVKMGEPVAPMEPNVARMTLEAILAVSGHIFCLC